jgi:hypothetical protein
MNEYQMEFNDLVIGPGTEYPVTVIEGLGSFSTRLESNPRTVEHGSLAIAKYLESKSIILQGYIDGATPGAKLDTLKTAFAPAESASPLRVWLDTGIRQINVQPTRFTMQHASGYKIGYVSWVMELHAADPKQYDDTQSSLTLDAFDPSDEAENEGNIATYPLLILEDGTSTPPTFTNLTTNESLTVDRSLVDGDQLVVDFSERTVRLNGVSDYANLDPDSTWWSLRPGVNEIEVDMSGTALAKFFWRSAWI